MQDTRKPVLISRVLYFLDHPHMVLELVCQHCNHGGIAEAENAADAVERSAELFTHATIHVRQAHPELADALDAAFFSRQPTAKWPNE